MCCELPSAIPNKKAPKIAWIPSHSVKAAAKKQKAIDNDKTPPGQASFLLIQGSTRLITALPTVSIKNVNKSVIPTVWMSDRLLPLPIKERITENINQPM